MPIPTYKFENPKAGVPPRPVPIRFACLATNWLPGHFVAVVLGRMAEGHSLIQVFQFERKLQRLGEVRRQLYEQYEEGLTKLRSQPLREQLALLPADHFVWSDDLVRAFSYDIDFTIGREDAHVFGLGILWQPVLGDCAAVIEECLDLSSIKAKTADEKAIETGENTIDVHDKVWILTFAGLRVYLKGSKGLEYIKVLVQAPQKKLSIYDLDSIVNPRDPNLVERNLNTLEVDPEDPDDPEGPSALSIGGLGDAGRTMDEKAKKNIESRIRKLKELIEDAREHGNTEKQAKLEEEMDQLLKYLRKNLNNKGKPRVNSSQHERTRKLILTAVTNAMKIIGACHPALAQHLEEHIQTGSTCCYSPPEGVRWQIKSH